MSTLKVNTVQHNTSGFNNVVQFTDGAGTENGVLCRAWVNFDGTSGSGTGSSDMTIRDEFNVSSITDGGTGWYTVNFATSMPDANYSSVVGGTGGGTNSGYATHDSSLFSGAGTNLGNASGFNIRTVDRSTGVAVDHPWVRAAVFR